MSHLEKQTTPVYELRKVINKYIIKKKQPIIFITSLDNLLIKVLYESTRLDGDIFLLISCTNSRKT